MTDRTLAEIAERIRHYSALLDDGLRYARRAAAEYADADDIYRVRHAKTFLLAKDDGATDALAKAHADIATEGIRRRARLAESMNRLAIKAVESRCTQVTAEQTLLNAHKEEAAFTRTSSREAA